MSNPRVREFYHDTHTTKQRLTEKTKPQSESAAVPPAADCGFWNLSMIGYATPANRDYGAVSSSEQQQGGVVGR